MGINIKAYEFVLADFTLHIKINYIMLLVIEINSGGNIIYYRK